MVTHFGEHLHKDSEMMKMILPLFSVATMTLFASAGQSVDLLTGRTLADFDCLLTDDKAAIARA